jgi:hypothetical protein
MHLQTQRRYKINKNGDSNEEWRLVGANANKVTKGFIQPSSNSDAFIDLDTDPVEMLAFIL